MKSNGCENSGEITIPSSVTSTDRVTLKDYQGLTSITIPSSVTKIGHAAFYNCKNLASITILNGVAEIGNEVFRSCQALTCITIANSVTEIGFSAFYGCKALKLIVVPDNLSIDKAHLGVDSITKIITHHALNSYIDTLNLQTKYPTPQRYMIYDLLHSANPTQTQFATLSTFITTEDFKIIVRQSSKDNIPPGILALYNFLNKNTWEMHISKFMTISDIANTRATEKKFRFNKNITDKVNQSKPLISSESTHKEAETILDTKAHAHKP